MQGSQAPAYKLRWAFWTTLIHLFCKKLKKKISWHFVWMLIVLNCWWRPWGKVPSLSFWASRRVMLLWLGGWVSAHEGFLSWAPETWDFCGFLWGNYFCLTRAQCSGCLIKYPNRLQGLCFLCDLRQISPACSCLARLGYQNRSCKCLAFIILLFL